MADIAIQIDTTADPAATYSGADHDRRGGWLVDHPQPDQRHGRRGRPDVVPRRPHGLGLRVDEAVPGKVLARHCIGGPPQWIGTDVRFALEPAPQGGTRILLDHTGFAQVDEMFRIVTLGWAQMLLHLKQYLDSGQPTPFFSY